MRNDQGEAGACQGMPLQVHGAVVDDQTRCEHWDGPHDVVAFQFPCCQEWYPCRSCHDQAVDHPAEVWGPEDHEEEAVLCGVCGSNLTIQGYMESGYVCPVCQAPFNRGCRSHWHLYFQT